MYKLTKTLEFLGNESALPRRKGQKYRYSVHVGGRTSVYALNMDL
jgi:hypothetical protein